MRFTVAPRATCTQSYDSVTGKWRYYAHINYYGVFFEAAGGRNLTDQYNQDKAVLEYSPLAEPVPATMPSEWYKHSVGQMLFFSNATTDNQYLLTFHVKSPTYDGATAAIYINGNLVRSEKVSGDEYIAVLVDCPPSQSWMFAYIFLAGGGILELKEIQCTVI